MNISLIFFQIALTLKTLKMPRSLSSSTQKLPMEALRHLQNLRELDLSHNKLRTMPETSFHFLKKLKVLLLHDNILDMILKGTFQGDIHSTLETISLSFNNIRTISQHTFVDLPSLEQLHLDDNKIDSLERRSFMNLENLKRLNLKGNKISKIADEAFQNLPEVEDLDLSYNSIKTLDFNIFDQVGTVGILQLNISHNKIVTLEVNPGNRNPGNCNIRVLDLSFNNITFIPGNFFQPTVISLTRLHLRNNMLTNATRDAFGAMPHLEFLDLSGNKLIEVAFDALRDTKNLQVFLASRNQLQEIPVDLFSYLKNLRMVDLSRNKIRFLPEFLFKEEGLEHLDLSHNHLGRMPLGSLSASAASTVTFLDLSHNSIAIVDEDLLSKFKDLRILDLSNNKLVELEPSQFGTLTKLRSLDLSNNQQLIGESNHVFLGLQHSLQHLKLDNVSLDGVPELLLPNLLTLSLGYNSLRSLPPEMATNVSLLRELELRGNDFSLVPGNIQNMGGLMKLGIGWNPIGVLGNASFFGMVEQLHELDLRDLPLEEVEVGF